MGNKRSLLSDIQNEIDKILPNINKPREDIISLDLFSGSGIVARLLKENGFQVITNDLEQYNKVINTCYLTNSSEFDKKEYDNLYSILQEQLKNPISGIITEQYAPKNTEDIKPGERAFYTHENALIIDTIRNYIDAIPLNMKPYFLAPLLYEASVHVNTSGVFKGFYKDKDTKIGKFGGSGENALNRIKSEIKLNPPIFSIKENNYTIYQKDANELVKELPFVDIAYLDPPYNQHPYGSNYFMLNVICNNKIPSDLSKVSGIPNDWNHSNYNKKITALTSMENLILNLNAQYIIISYNNEGFISYNEMVDLLSKYGTLDIREIKYNTFRGSRNLNNRNIYTKEYLFILNK